MKLSEEKVLHAAREWWKSCGRLGPRMCRGDSPLGDLAAEIEDMMRESGEYEEWTRE